MNKELSLSIPETSLSETKDFQSNSLNSLAQPPNKIGGLKTDQLFAASNIRLGRKALESRKPLSLGYVRVQVLLLEARTVPWQPLRGISSLAHCYRCRLQPRAKYSRESRKLPVFFMKRKCRYQTSALCRRVQRTLKKSFTSFRFS